MRELAGAGPVWCWFSFRFGVGFPSGFNRQRCAAAALPPPVRGPVWDLFTNRKSCTNLKNSSRNRSWFGTGKPSGFVRRAYTLWWNPYPQFDPYPWWTPYPWRIPFTWWTPYSWWTTFLWWTPYPWWIPYPWWTPLCIEPLPSTPVHRAISSCNSTRTVRDQLAHPAQRIEEGRRRELPAAALGVTRRHHADRKSWTKWGRDDLVGFHAQLIRFLFQCSSQRIRFVGSQLGLVTVKKLSVNLPKWVPQTVSWWNYFDYS